MEYCRYCNEQRKTIVWLGIQDCPDNPNGRHSYTTKSYENGYALGEYLADKIIAIFRSLFGRK